MATAALLSLVEPSGNIATLILKKVGSLFNTKQIAQMAGVSMRTAQRWLTNATQKRRPGLDSLRKLARNIKWRVQAVFSNDSDKDIHATFELNPYQSKEISNYLLADNEIGAKNVLAQIYFQSSKTKWRLSDIESLVPA